MLVPFAHEILVERPGVAEPCSLWLFLRSSDLDTASEEDLHMIVNAAKARGEYFRFSILIQSLGPDLEIRQDITDAVFAQADKLPPQLPVLAEHLASGALFVWQEQSRRLPASRAEAIFQEALTWCADDYADLLTEFQDLLTQRQSRD